MKPSVSPIWEHGSTCGETTNVYLLFEVDIEAAVSLVRSDIWKRSRSPHLTSPKSQLFSHCKQPIPVIGECNIIVSCNGDNQALPLIAVEKAGTSFFALDWINAFQVACKHPATR